MTTCAICGLPFEAKTSYGLCPLCWSKDKLREWDRLESAICQARRSHLPATLDLVTWLAVLSDSNTRCLYCMEAWAHFIEIVDTPKGLVKGNVVPACFSCHQHKARSWQVAEARVAAYLAGHVTFRVEGLDWQVQEEEEVSHART